MFARLVLSPTLELSPDEVVEAWNADPDCREKADMQAATSGMKNLDPAILNNAIAILTPIAINVVSSAVYDLIKNLLEKKGRASTSTHLHIEETTRPDGTYILIVDLKEGT